MSLGWELAATLPYLRTQAVSRFTEVFEFFTLEDSAATSESLGSAGVKVVLASDVAGRVKVAALQPRDEESAGQSPVVSRFEVHVGVGSHVADPNQFVRVVSSSADAGLVGRVFRVVDGPGMGQVTAWRIPVEDAGFAAGDIDWAPSENLLPGEDVVT